MAHIGVDKTAYTMADDKLLLLLYVSLRGAYPLILFTRVFLLKQKYKKILDVTHICGNELLKKNYFIFYFDLICQIQLSWS